MWCSHCTASYDTWWTVLLWSYWRPEAAQLSELCASNLKITQYFSVVVTSGSFLWFLFTCPKFLQWKLVRIWFRSSAWPAEHALLPGICARMTGKNHWTALLIVQKTEKWVETVSQLSSKTVMSLSFFWVIKIHFSWDCLLWIFVF